VLCAELNGPKPVPIPMMPPATDADRAQQAQERKAYSRVCKTPVPPTGDRCKDAKANRDRLKQCLQMREAFGKKWFNDGDHDPENANTARAIEKIDEFLRGCPLIADRRSWRDYR
jgi:hypothetical protein